MTLGFAGVQGRHLVRQGRPDHPRGSTRASSRGARQSQGIRTAVSGRAHHPAREVQQGDRVRTSCTERVAEEMVKMIRTAPPGVPINSVWMMSDSVPAQRANQAARRHARADGKTLRRDHLDPDHLEFQGGLDRARILQLDARRAQGPGRHRTEDREFGVPDPVAWSMSRRTQSSPRWIAAQRVG